VGGIKRSRGEKATDLENQKHITKTLKSQRQWCFNDRSPATCCDYTTDSYIIAHVELHYHKDVIVGHDPKLFNRHIFFFPQRDYC